MFSKKLARAEATARLIDTRAAVTESDEDVLAITDALRLNVEHRESFRAVTKERMLRAFELAGQEDAISDDAGTRDEDAKVVADVYTAEMRLPGGGRVRFADVENIDVERAQAASRHVYLDFHASADDR